METTEVTEVQPTISMQSNKSMQISMDNPVHAFQTIVSRANPDYIVTLHKLLGTMAACAAELKH